MASAVSGDSARQALEKAKTLPIAEARKSALGLARTQPLSAIPAEPKAVEAKVAGPRRVRPVAQLPFKPVAEAKPIAPAPVAERKPELKPIVMKPLVPSPATRVKAPAMTAGIVPASAVDDGWSQGRKRSRVEPASPLRAIKVAEGTQPGVSKTAPARPTVPEIKAVLAERPKLAEGSIAPPPAASDRPLPSLFSVIDRKPAAAAAAGSSSRLPGLPPPSPSRPSTGPKKAVSTVVAAASIGAAPMAMAQARQTGEHARVPPPAQMMLEEEIEEIEEIEPDLPDFVPTATATAGMIMRARSAPALAPAPLFDAPPRQMAMPPAATSFSAAEAAFFAAGEEMDTIDMDTEQETFEDLPGVERPSFWSRLKNRASAP